jgi:hypothetical protein
MLPTRTVVVEDVRVRIASFRQDIVEHGGVAVAVGVGIVLTVLRRV